MDGGPFQPARVNFIDRHELQIVHILHPREAGLDLLGTNIKPAIIKLTQDFSEKMAVPIASRKLRSHSSISSRISLAVAT